MAVPYEWQNPIFNSLGFIDCEINLPGRGWVSFSASPDDSEEAGVLTYNDILGSGQLISPYIPPTIAQIRASMTPLTQRQMRVALLNGGTSTANLNTAINGIGNPAAKELARIIFDHADRFSRLDASVVLVLGVRLGMTDTQIDTFWDAALLI
jgi:hypothetical protein